MSDAFSRELSRLNPAWKKNLSIPRRGSGTSVVLMERLRGLWKALQIETPLGYECWSLNRLYAEWFERTAEYIILKTDPGARRRIQERVLKDRSVQGILF